VNVKATFFLIKEAIPYLEQQKNSSIVVVSSIAAYAPFELIGAYSISKTTLLGLTKALVNPCIAKGIRINGIAPGVIKTKFSQVLWENGEANDAAQPAFDGCPMGRVGTPDECAGTVSFLASDDASYITGETLVIAGGTQSRL
jgi:dehydrogenase/reductase SDR family member 4